MQEIEPPPETAPHDHDIALAVQGVERVKGFPPDFSAMSAAWSAAREAVDR